MDFNYIIVQCGGMGTRLMPYTRNMPKAMVPVNNRPIIFHLFERYPDKHFVVINDYRSEVLDRYLENFAKVSYLTIRSEQKGNIAGVKQALACIPVEESFMLLWSDLILGDSFITEQLPDAGCYVGVTRQFPCSWSSTDGRLDKIPGDKGIAGCFIFRDKSVLGDIPDGGSLTVWLRDRSIPYTEMDMEDTVEVGTVESLKRVDSKENRCRPYNRITVNGERVIKEGLTDDARKLLEHEVSWFDLLVEKGYKGIPKIYRRNPLTMERIHGTNIFRADIAEDRKEAVLIRMIERLKALHAISTGRPDAFDHEKDYYRKTIQRLRTIEAVIPFTEQKTIKINNRDCTNILRRPEVLHRLSEHFRSDEDYGVLHGDCTFTNTLIDDREEIYFIDARGYFGDSALIGDVDYDWAKVYYSIIGAFDRFNVGGFDMTITDEDVIYSIEESGWEDLEDVLWQEIGEDRKLRVRFIHAVIWLSLASHCWENYDAMCLAYYNGLYLLQGVADETGAGIRDGVVA